MIKAEVSLIHVGQHRLSNSDRRRVRNIVGGFSHRLMDEGCVLETFEWCESGDALIGLSFRDKQATAALEVLREFGHEVTEAVDGRHTTRTFSPSIALAPA